jgi:hypothetical protein
VVSTNFESISFLFSHIYHMCCSVCLYNYICISSKSRRFYHLSLISSNYNASMIHNTCYFHIRNPTNLRAVSFYTRKSLVLNVFYQIDQTLQICYTCIRKIKEKLLHGLFHANSTINTARRQKHMIGPFS